MSGDDEKPDGLTRSTKLGGDRSASVGIFASRSGDVENGDVASL
jgi:hypothetical protein